MGILSFLRRCLFESRISPATQSPAILKHEDRVRHALLLCETLTEAEVDEYISYEFHGVVFEEVSADYSLFHPGAKMTFLYANGVLEAALLLRHTNQIAPETLEKVRQVLPVIFLH